MTALLAPCARCATPLEHGDLRCAICCLVAPAPPSDERVGQAELAIVRCTECGAAVTYKVEVAAPMCRFCGAKTAVEIVVDPLEEATHYLPFGVSQEQATSAIQSFLSQRSFFVPADLAASATVSSVVPILFAAWVFDARADVTWTADSDAGSRRSAWAPHAGRTRMQWSNVLVSASRGLSRSEVHRLAGGFNLGRAVPIEEERPADVEQFDVERSAARGRILEAIQGLAERDLAAGHIPGRTYRNLHVSAWLEGLTTRRFAMPAYVFVYRYKDRPYRAVVHGQDASVAFGDRPIAMGRVALLVLGALVVIAIIVLIVRS